MKLFKSCLVAGLVLCGAGTCLAEGPTVTAAGIGSAPTLDGSAAEWGGVTGTTIKVTPANDGDAKNYTGAIDVTVKSAVNGDNIYFLVEWPDDTKDASHKSLTWSEEEDGYVKGKDREDRVIMKFDMEGDFTACMLSGKAYKADIWHWKAFRSGSAGYAHDKMHVFSFDKMPKAKEHPTRDGKSIWVARPSDKGSKPYKGVTPLDNEGASIPYYQVSKTWTGSIGDVRAQAVHDGSKWTVELQRKLDTGNADDVKFAQGKTFNAGIALFNHTGDDHHSVASFTLDIK